MQEVARAIGPGFGGSCFQKDILNLVYLCGHYCLHEMDAYWQQVVAVNTWQQHRISALVVRRLFGTVTGKRIAVLGFAYGLRPTASTKPTRTTPARPPPSASAAIFWKKAPSWRSLIPRWALSRSRPIWGWRPLWVQRARGCGSRLWILVPPFVERMRCCCSLSGSSSGCWIGQPWRR